MGAVIPHDDWDLVQSLRSRYSRRHPGATSRRKYALSSLLFCAACGRQLTGHCGRYRHVEACAAFVQAKPRPNRRWSNSTDRRIRGQSYPAEVYDASVETVLSKASVEADTAASVLAQLAAPPTRVLDTAVMEQIERERRRLTSVYLDDRDLTKLERGMIKLDNEHRAMLSRPVSRPKPEEARAYLEDLPRLWRETDTEGRQALARSLFARVEVLGTSRATFELTAEAERMGFLAAIGASPLRCSIGRYGRGERI